MCGIIPKMSEPPSSTNPCPFYSTGHCSKMKKNECPFSHNQKTCWMPWCKRHCGGRHPKPCKLYYTTGCFWKECSYLHAPPPPPPPLREPPPQHPVLFASTGEQSPDIKDQPVVSTQLAILQQQVRDMTKEKEEKNRIISQLQKNVSSLETKVSKLSQDHEASIQNLNTKVTDRDAHLSRKLTKIEDNNQSFSVEVSQLSTTFHQIDEKFAEKMTRLYEKSANLEAVNTAFIQLQEKLAGEISTQYEQNRSKFTNVFAIIELQNSKIAKLQGLTTPQPPCPVQYAAPPPIPERNKHEEPATLHRLTSRD